MKLDKQFSNMKLKQLLSENVLGSLPSSKLMKMKWNPVTQANSVNEDNISSDLDELHEAIFNLNEAFATWKMQFAPMTLNGVSLDPKKTTQ